MKFQQITEGLGQDADLMEQDHEVQMARADCFHAAKNAIELHNILKNISERQGLEGWVSEKITLAADYLRTVKEYLEYETVNDESISLPATDYAGSFDQYMMESSKRKKKISEDEELDTKKAARRITTPGIDANARSMLIKGYGRHPESQNDVAVLANIAADLEDRSRVEIDRLNREKNRLDRDNQVQDQEIDSLEQLADRDAQEIQNLRAALDDLAKRIAARKRLSQQVSARPQEPQQGQ